MRLRNRWHEKGGGISSQHMLLDDFCDGLRLHLAQRGASGAGGHFVFTQTLWLHI